MPYYAVKKGKKPGIYESWEECKAQVHGYKGAEFKKFPDRAMAISYINEGNDSEGNDSDSPSTPENGPKNIPKSALKNGPEEQSQLPKEPAPPLENLPPGALTAYVDGSYNKKTKTYGYGIVLFSAAGKEEFSGSAKGEESSSRNVAGEILAAKMAMQIARSRQANSLTLFYDYAGIRHWALGEWKANLPLTKDYQDFAQEIGKDLTLSFQKVQAHTGDRWNEEADRLAKKGCGLA